MGGSSTAHAAARSCLAGRTTTYEASALKPTRDAFVQSVLFWTKRQPEPMSALHQASPHGQTCHRDAARFWTLGRLRHDQQRVGGARDVPHSAPAPPSTLSRSYPVRHVPCPRRAAGAGGGSAARRRKKTQTHCRRSRRGYRRGAGAGNATARARTAPRPWRAGLVWGKERAGRRPGRLRCRAGCTGEGRAKRGALARRAAGDRPVGLSPPICPWPASGLPWGC